MTNSTPGRSASGLSPRHVALFGEATMQMRLTLGVMAGETTDIQRFFSVLHWFPVVSRMSGSWMVGGLTLMISSSKWV